MSILKALTDFLGALCPSPSPLMRETRRMSRWDYRRHKTDAEAFEADRRALERDREVWAGAFAVAADDERLRVMDPNGDLPRCKPTLGRTEVCCRCGGPTGERKACPSVAREHRWRINWSKQ